METKAFGRHGECGSPQAARLEVGDKDGTLLEEQPGAALEAGNYNISPSCQNHDKEVVLLLFHSSSSTFTSASLFHFLPKGLVCEK